MAGAPRRGLPWHGLGFAIGAAIAAAALFVLMRLLNGIDIQRVAADVRAMPASHIGHALLFAAGSYVALTSYDVFALRAIGARHVPYRVAVLASFSAYAIGHNIGATAFSGGAIRYRVYSQFGLGVIDVARICFLTGLTFWLGNVTILGFGLAGWPDGAAHIVAISPAVMRLFGIAALVLLVAYVGWVSRRPRTLGRGNWIIVIPGGFSTIQQIGIALADLGSSSLAMYSLLPSGESYTTVAVAFIASTLLGFASHAPGSLGVFDAAMLVALPQFGREELVASLLVYRVLYFMIPFGIALIAMTLWEVSLVLGKRRTDVWTGTVATLSSPSPLVGEGRGGGSFSKAPRCPDAGPPPPTPPHKGTGS
jgi:glycosyltransferase 2 family protein